MPVCFALISRPEEVAGAHQSGSCIPLHVSVCRELEVPHGASDAFRGPSKWLPLEYIVLHAMYTVCREWKFLTLRIFLLRDTR